ncbi:MAG: translation initiation factor eIF-1A [Candidatus Micrarchaeia archaeon]
MNEEEQHELRLPKEKEMLGVVVAMLGASMAKIICEDGKERKGRIPGRLKRSMWIKSGDVVLVIPWPVSGDKGCDIVYRYSKADVEALKEKGLLKNLPLS